MQHPLHKIVGEIVEECIDSNEFPNCKIIKDPACGGQQNIPLFCSEKKSNATEYCNVDLLILKDNRIRVIIEIEETDVKPTQICGKFLTSALSSYLIHKPVNSKPISMGESVLFIQILDALKVKEKGHKIEQWKNIQKSIRNIIPVRDSKIGNYRLLFGDLSKFETNGEKREELINFIQEALR